MGILPNSKALDIRRLAALTVKVTIARLWTAVDERQLCPRSIADFTHSTHSTHYDVCHRDVHNDSADG